MGTSAADQSSSAMVMIDRLLTKQSNQGDTHMLTVRQPNGFLSYAWMETNPLAEEAARVVQTLAAYHAGEDIDDPLTEQIDDDTFDEMVDALLAHQREYTTVEIEVVFTEQ